MTVRAVIFDIGNVLYEWHPRFLIERLTADEAVRARLGAAITPAWHFQHDSGRDFADTSRELIAEFPDCDAYILEYGPRFAESIRGPMPGMLELVRDLDARGVPLFAITNFSHEFFPPFRKAHAEIFGRFRDIVVSGVEKLTKPDPAIFHLALQRFQLAPGAGLFVDDMVENAGAAARCGFVPHHFTDANRLRAQLETLKLL